MRHGRKADSPVTGSPLRCASAQSEGDRRHILTGAGIWPTPSRDTQAVRFRKVYAAFFLGAQ